MCNLAADATLVTVVHDAGLLPLLADRVFGLKGGPVVFDLPRGRLDAGMLTNLYQAGVPSLEPCRDS